MTMPLSRVLGTADGGRTTLRCLSCLTLASVLGLASVPAFAHGDGNVFVANAPRLLLSAGLNFGGDDLATVEYNGYLDNNLEAGGGLYLGAGFEFPLASDMALRTAVGYQFDAIDASNGEASFDRIPWDAMIFLGPGPHRLGIGLTYHTDVRYEFKEDYHPAIDAEFDDALGLSIAYEMQFAPEVGVMFTYTDIEYEERAATPGERGRVIDGSHFGISANFLF